MGRLLDYFNHKYPYSDFHELNADWIISEVKELIEIMDNFIDNETITFADPITWNITTQYSKNTVVIDYGGNAYLSKEVVPSGIQLNDSRYWIEIFNFTAYTRTSNKNLTVNTETNTTRATAAYQVDDWLIWNDVLYKVTSSIAVDDTLIVSPDVGANLVHFTVEDFIKAFMTWATNTIQQYKNDIDASEILYRAQLAQDIADTTASLQAQLDIAIAGVTVDSEVINARIGANNITYSTLGEAIRTQFTTTNHILDIMKNGYDMTSKIRPLVTDYLLGWSSNGFNDEQSTIKASFGGGLYVCNRDYLFINNSKILNPSDVVEFIILTFDEDKNLIDNSGWLYKESYFIPKDSCEFFLIQMRYYSHDPIADLDDFASYIDIYVSKEEFDKNSIYPNMFMIGAVDADNYKTIRWRANQMVAVFPYVFNDSPFILYANMGTNDLVYIVSGTDGSKLLNTGYHPYPTQALPIMGNYGILQFRTSSNPVVLTVAILEAMAENISITPAAPDKVQNYPMPLEGGFKAYSHKIGTITTPENTFPALRISYLSGFRCFESDVQLSSDGVPVLCHNATIDNVSTGSGRIDSMTYSQLQTYDFGSWKGALWTGVSMLSLEIALQFAKKHNCYLNLELKADANWSTANITNVLNMVNSYGMHDRVIWNNNGNAGYTILANMLTIDDTLEISLGLDSWNSTSISQAAQLLTGKNKVHIFRIWTDINSDLTLIETAKTLGLIVDTHYIYAADDDRATVNIFDDWIANGIDGCITEQPSMKLWSDLTDYYPYEI